MRVADLDYDLPPELIAQRPAEPRRSARLLVLDTDSGAIAHHRVADLPTLIRPSLLVVNDTRVRRARLLGAKPTGGRVELFLLRRESGESPEEVWRVLGKSNKPLRVGQAVVFSESLRAVVGERLEGPELRVRLLSTDAGVSASAAAERVGHVPLPPYIQRADDETDGERYQTVFADRSGAVAAPTAGLHFDAELLAALEEAGHALTRVTLHVGAGTFRPIRATTLDQHAMHEERYDVSPDAASAIASAADRGRPLLAIGTTVVRTLEASQARAGEGETRLFLRPPARPTIARALLTNFHLPRSTLLALVMSFAGIEATRAAYAEAVRARYRFFSYGDAMLIRPPESRPEGAS